jgi:hypothetical protein
VVLPSLAVVLFYLFGSMMSLAVVSEILLAHRDRSYLRRLAEVLTTEARLGVGDPGGEAAE